MVLEFVVVGVPKSAQSKSGKPAWKAKVAAALPAGTVARSDRVRMRVAFFFNGSTDLDVDNILKPICDALNGGAYNDDAQVVEITAAKWDLTALPPLVNPSPVLLSAVSAGGDFVYIRVDDAPAEVRLN